MFHMRFFVCMHNVVFVLASEHASFTSAIEALSSMMIAIILFLGCFFLFAVSCDRIWIGPSSCTYLLSILSQTNTKRNQTYTQIHGEKTHGEKHISM